MPKFAANDCFIKPKPVNPKAAEFNAVLLDTIDKLKEALSKPVKYIAIDTETTGLDHVQCHMVGYSFALEPTVAYYVPVKHHSSGLGDEAVQILYDYLLKNMPTIAMFNAAFDIRVFEYYDITPENYKPNFKPRFDFAPFQPLIYDTQLAIFIADTNMPMDFLSLKTAEQHFLGYPKRPNYLETVGDNYNLYYLDPEEVVYYASADAHSTYNLGIECDRFIREASAAGQIKKQCTYPLTKYMEQGTTLDVDMLHKYKEILEERIEAAKQQVFKISGYEFNIGSSPQKAKFLEEQGIHTGKVTAKGNIAAGKDVLNDLYATMEEDDPARPAIKALVDYNSLRTQLNGFCENLLKCAENAIPRNYPRFGYRAYATPTGRLAAGNAAKDTFFGAINIQNIPKPHVELSYVTKWDDNTQTERWNVLGWHVYPKPPAKDSIDPATGKYPEVYECETFKQDLNFRAAFMADSPDIEDPIWLSLDYSGEEMRIGSILFNEPVWMDGFRHNKDVHMETARKIFGPDATKDDRKRAKSVNFGIMYGMGPSKLAQDFKMTLEEAEAFIERYKAALPTLFAGMSATQNEARKNGTVYTLFGLPRRLATYFNSPKRGQYSFGMRSAVNTRVQGTGGDILSLSMVRLWNAIFKYPGAYTICQFKNTVHDEINYAVSIKHLPKLLVLLHNCMRMDFPQWGGVVVEPTEAGLGPRWGQNVDFKVNWDTGEILHPKGDLYVPKEEKPKEEPKIEEVKEEPVVQKPVDDFVIPW